MQRLQPGLQPITLFEHLQDKYPGQYDKNHRTLQRRIKQWHALYGSDQEVISVSSNSQDSRRWWILLSSKALSSSLLARY